MIMRHSWMFILSLVNSIYDGPNIWEMIRSKIKSNDYFSSLNKGIET